MKMRLVADNIDCSIDLYPYHKQIIIDFCESDSAKLLQSKWRILHSDASCVLISGNDFLKSASPIFASQNGGNLKIYIDFHSKPGTDYVEDESGNNLVHVKVLAKQLATVIGNQQAVINLLGCASAKGTDDNTILTDEAKNSFAAKLHAALYAITARNIPVIARMQIVIISRLFGRKSTYDLAYNWNESLAALEDEKYHRHQQNGSKVIFTLDENGYQIKKDAYLISWKRQLLKTLQKIILKSTSDSIIFLLSEWHHLFPTLSAEDVLQHMQQELTNQHTVLDNNDCCSFKRLFWHSKEYIAINELVKKGQQILSSSYIIKDKVVVQKLSLNHS